MRSWLPANLRGFCLAALGIWPGLCPLWGQGSLGESLLAIKINGKEVSDGEPVLELGPSRFFITAPIFRAARLHLPNVVPERRGGMEYYPLDAIPGIQTKIDRAAQVLEITAPTTAFFETTLDGLGNQVTAPTPSEPGFFLNHDFQMITQAQETGASQRILNGLVEGGFFSRLGVLTTQYAARDLFNHTTPLRLSTQFFRDFPGNMTTLAIGDSLSAGGPWAKRVYYAGVRWASNFSTQPNFIPTGLPGLSGQVSQPSTVDIYVDNVRTLSRPLDTGPFSIRNIPVISGQGEIQMVVTDIFGRQQVIRESYLRSAELLRKGVNEFTYEAGVERLGYGFKSNLYSGLIVAGSQRYGVTDSLTLEGRVEIQPGVETVGVGAVYGIRGIGVVGAGAVGSLEHADLGKLIYADYSFRQRALGFAARAQESSNAFRQIGLGRNEKATKMLLQGEISRALGNHGTIAGGYLRRDGRTEENVRALTVSLSLRVGRSFLSLGGIDSLLKPQQYGINVSWIMPLGGRKMAIATADANSNSRVASAEVSQQLPLGPGYGYRVKTTELDQRRTEASFSYQTLQGTYSIDGDRLNDRTSFRFSERSSLVFLHRHLMVSQWLNDSFGVVKVLNARGVPIYVNNQMLAKTGRNGFALMPWLIPYNPNSIRLDDSALPLDVSLSLEDRTIVPMPRSGVFLEYKAESVGGATVVLLTPAGDPMPLGALVHVNGKSAEYQVALRGEAFISDIEYPATLQVKWDAGECRVRIDQPPAGTLVPRIGPLTCK